MLFCEICELKIRINNRYENIARLCRDYIVPGDVPDMVLEATEEEIDSEQKIYPEPPRGYHEAVIIFRKLCRRALEYGVFFLHSAAVELDGTAYLFCGKSGAGKSTHARLWCEAYPRAVVINGDKPLIRRKADGFYVYGTPWCGKEMQQKNTSAPVGAVCFIEQSRENQIRPMSKAEVIGKIFNQTVYQAELAANEELFSLLDKFIGSTPFYLLKCNMTADAALLAHRVMSGN